MTFYQAVSPAGTLSYVKGTWNNAIQPIGKSIIRPTGRRNFDKSLTRRLLLQYLGLGLHLYAAVSGQLAVHDPRSVENSISAPGMPWRAYPQGRRSRRYRAARHLEAATHRNATPLRTSELIAVFDAATSTPTKIPFLRAEFEHFCRGAGLWLNRSESRRNSCLRASCHGKSATDRRCHVRLRVTRVGCQVGMDVLRRARRHCVAAPGTATFLTFRYKTTGCSAVRPLATPNPPLDHVPIF